MANIWTAVCRNREACFFDRTPFDPFDVSILVDSFDAKAEVVENEGMLVYFDDQSKMLKNYRKAPMSCWSVTAATLTSTTNDGCCLRKPVTWFRVTEYWFRLRIFGDIPFRQKGTTGRVSWYSVHCLN